MLGLIFEKIRGYKDGSIFTPGFITMYMSRETVRRAVIQKFKEDKGWDCSDFTGSYNKIDDLQEAIFHEKQTVIKNCLFGMDINIKCGNSLASRYPLDADLRKALKGKKWNIDDGGSSSRKCWTMKGISWVSMW